MARWTGCRNGSSFRIGGALVPVRVLVDLLSLSRIPIAAAATRRATPDADAQASADGVRLLAEAASEARLPLNQRALPTIGRLAREGRLELCTYAEICGAPSTAGPRGTVLDLLGDVTIATVEPAIDRAAIDSDVFRDAAQSGALLRFCTRVKSGHQGLEQLPIEFVARLPDTTRRGLASLHRFRELAARTQGEHLVDLFHLWTGELAGCDYLLAMDGGIEAFLDGRVRPNLDEPLHCNPIEPEDLLVALQVEERDPPPAMAGTVVSLDSPRGPHGRGHLS
jgi:hypothetical protein